jgi:hypothetical protein
MSKYVADLAYTFTPSTSKISFSSHPGFNIRWLSAIIDVTTNAFIYLPGVSGFGLSALDASGTILTLSNPLAGCSSTDLLNFHYDDQQNALAGMLSLQNGDITNPATGSPNMPVGVVTNSPRLEELVERLWMAVKTTNYLLAKQIQTPGTYDSDGIEDAYYQDLKL